jgi:dTMP kinase
VFISVDGIDGAGKTTLCQQIAALVVDGKVLLTKEPTGSSEAGRILRESSVRGRLNRDEETRLFHEDRLEHLSREIVPALRNGRVVVCDRYVDSTLAYQAGSIDEANAMYERFLPEILVPRITFIVKCDVKIALGRISKFRDTTSMFETTETLERAKSIFEARKGAHYRFIDGSGTIENTFNAARACLPEILKGTRKVNRLERFRLKRSTVSMEMKFA